MIILNEQQMWDAVTLEDIMSAVEKAYEIHKAGTYYMPDRFIAARDKDLMMYMPCFTDEMIGTKMLAEFPGNPSRGLAYLNGLMLLNDAETGLPKAVMNGSAITTMRTGGAGGVALKYLSREDCSSLGPVGCGVQGLHQLIFACAVRPIKDIYLFDTFRKDINIFIEDFRRKSGRSDVNFHICSDTRQLAENSDILISATQTTDPLFPDEDELLRGKCILAFGSWRPERRELPDAVHRLVKKIYTELPYACEESGDLRIPLEKGLLTEDRVLYMEDLIADAKNGRPHSHNETRCFKSVGMGIYDVCTAALIYRKAAEKNIGTAIEW